MIEYILTNLKTHYFVNTSNQYKYPTKFGSYTLTLTLTQSRPMFVKTRKYYKKLFSNKFFSTITT